MRHFRDALEIDPSYALPYAGLATCYVVLPAYDREHSIDCYRNARAAALKALEMDSRWRSPMPR
jgi:Tfp pilus assembly protein PilF